VPLAANHTEFADQDATHRQSPFLTVVRRIANSPYASPALPDLVDRFEVYSFTRFPWKSQTVEPVSIIQEDHSFTAIYHFSFEFLQNALAFSSA
jgi:hypothetical protein